MNVQKVLHKVKKTAKVVVKELFQNQLYLFLIDLLAISHILCIKNMLMQYHYIDRNRLEKAGIKLSRATMAN